MLSLAPAAGVGGCRGKATLPRAYLSCCPAPSSEPEPPTYVYVCASGNPLITLLVSVVCILDVMVLAEIRNVRDKTWAGVPNKVPRPTPAIRFHIPEIFFLMAT